EPLPRGAIEDGIRRCRSADGGDRANELRLVDDVLPQRVTGTEEVRRDKIVGRDGRNPFGTRPTARRRIREASTAYGQIGELRGRASPRRVCAVSLGAGGKQRRAGLRGLCEKVAALLHVVDAAERDRGRVARAERSVAVLGRI